jgi:hypothetical protein
MLSRIVFHGHYIFSHPFYISLEIRSLHQSMKVFFSMLILVTVT